MASETQTRVVLVTGGSAGGIGHATAVAFARLGCKVAITGRARDRLQQALEDMKTAAPAGTQAEEQFLVVQVDFEDPKQVDALVGQVVAKFGQLDVLVNNAGFPGQYKGLLEEGFYENYLNVMQVNLFAPARLAQLAAPHLLKAPRGGVIVNVSSVCERVPVRNGPYAISKAGLNMLTLTLANSFDGKNVRAITVSPGPIVTNFVPGYRGDASGRYSTLAGRSGTADEVANVIVFVASEQASYMTGTTVEVDGGFFCKSGLLISDATSKGRAEHLQEQQQQPQ